MGVTSGFATSHSNELTAVDGGYTADFTDSYGDKISFFVPAASATDGYYTVTYPDGYVAKGTILHTAISTSSYVEGFQKVVTFSTELLSASVSGDAATYRPVPELVEYNPSVAGEISFSFLDAETGHLIKVTGSQDQLYKKIYRDTITGEVGSADYVKHASGIDYFVFTAASSTVTPPPAAPSIPAPTPTPETPVPAPSTPAPTAPTAPTLAPAPAPSTPAPTAVAPSSKKVLPQTGDSLDLSREAGVALLGGALTLAAIKRKKKKSEEEPE
jgi:LPXTG-motif cell wall-anchored protein